MLISSFFAKTSQNLACKFKFTLVFFLVYILQSKFGLLFYVYSRPSDTDESWCKNKYTGLGYAKK